MRQVGHTREPPNASRRPLEEAAAVRWFVARSQNREAAPHEILEYSASVQLLDRIEESCPGLRPFLDDLMQLASLAAGIKLAASVALPIGIRASLEEAVAEGWRSVSETWRGLETPDLDLLLNAYASLADIAGVVSSERFDWPFNELKAQGGPGRRS